LSLFARLQTSIRVETPSVPARHALPLVLLALVPALGGCGGSTRLATVGDRQITRADVGRLLEHGQEEARREGAGFPAAGSAGHRALEREGLAILVARAQVEQAARRIGIRIADAEIARQVELPRRKEGIELVYENARRSLGIAEQEQGEGRALLADAVRLQLTLRKVQRRVGAARLQQWVADARTSVPVEYADGRRP
jgi:hypothetical protein